MGNNATTLSMKDNLYYKGLNSPERSEFVYSQDYGYNMIQQMIDRTSRVSGGSKRVYNQKFEMHKMPPMGVSETIGAAATTTGAGTGNIIITFNRKNQGFRERDIVADSNMIQGKVERVINDGLQLELSPVSTSWNTSLHFTATGVNPTAKVLFDASPNRHSRGKTSLTRTPDLDFGYTGVSRESNSMYIADGIKTYPQWKGKNWYTSHQSMTLKEWSRREEYKIVFSERRVLHEGTARETYTPMGLRWAIMNLGGTYYQTSGNVTKNELHDFMNTMMLKSASDGRKIIALPGQEFRSAIMNLNENAVIQSGTNNTFGGSKVRGFNTYTYAAQGLEFEMARYALWDDPTMFPEISAITGRRRWSNSCLFLDMTPIPLEDGTGSVSAISKRHFGAKEYRMAYINGMMSLEEMNDERVSAIMDRDGYSLAQNDLDACQFELYSNTGYYIIPRMCGLIELAG